ncbi:MAG: phage major capsid protein [Alphaproteobacteria bacterium]|nr:phage major capsid protein [Alphaproteobacteria bacterium]
MKLRELREKRAALVAQMRAINDAPESDKGGDLSETQSKKFDILKGELELVEKQEDRQKLIDEADRRAGGEVIAGDKDHNFDREIRTRYSLVRAMAGAAGLDVDDAFEREASGEIKRRNAGGAFQGLAVPMQVFEKRVVTTTAPAGGPGTNIIATDFLGEHFIDILRSQLVTQQRGATVLSGLVGNVDIPLLKTSAVSGWVAENTALTASDQAFDKISLAPKHVGALTEFSRNMLMQSTPDIEQLIRSDFAAVLARALDAAALVGGGTNEPTGLIAAGIDTSVSMATPSWSNILDLINIVEEADAQGNGFVMRPLVAKKLRETPKVASTDSVMVMEAPDSLAGYPVSRSTLVPIDTVPTPDETSIIFGQWSDLFIGYFSAFDLLVNPYESTAYSKGNVSVRGMLTADIAVRHIESFAAATDFPAA